MPSKALVKPEVLSWSRTTAGLTVEDAARLLAVKAEQVSDWEAGGDHPTMGQVRRMADKYRRPLNVFFFEKPPAESGEPELPDFRSGGGFVPAHSRYLRIALRTANEWRLDALDMYGAIEAEPRKFTLQIKQADGVEKAAEALRAWIGVTLETQLSWPSADDRYRALREWRDHIEANDVLVFQFGRIEVAEMRGSSLYFEHLPTIVLNSGDTPNGRIFTMMHELTHLALRGSGLCDVRYVQPNARINNAIETFCNAVAGALLVPAEVLLREEDVAAAKPDTEWSDARVTQLANLFKVSRLVILRRLLSLQKTNEAAYNARHLIWSAAGPNNDGGGDGRRIALNARGQLLTKLVLSAYSAKKITLFDTAKRLGIKADSIAFAREFVRS
jgi:Zn-dependent peptidase ImmA (M78 family)